TVVLFPILDNLEKLGKYVLKCELDMEDFPSKSLLKYDDKDINDNLSKFIYSTNLIVSPFEKELNNLKTHINDHIIPAFLDNDGRLFSDHVYLSGKLGVHLLVFADNKNLIKMVDFISMKVNGLKNILNSHSEVSLKPNIINEAELIRNNNLTTLRHNLILVHISLMRSIGLDVLADKLSNALNKVNISQSRSQSWNELIKLLPKLFFSELHILESSLKFPVRDRLNYIFRRSNFNPSYDADLKKSKQRFNHHLIMVENVLNNRFSYGLDGDFCLKIINEISSYSLPLLPVQKFESLGDMSVIVLDRNKYEMQRGFSFRGLVDSKTVPKIEIIEKIGSHFNALLNDLNFENVPGSHYYKITGNFYISRLKNDLVIAPYSSSLLFKVTHDLMTDYFDIPVLINTNKPELELVFRNINGDLVEDNFKSRTLSEGEKYSIFVKNNTSKPREAYVKISSGLNKLFLADTKVLCPDNEEVSVFFKPNMVPLKSDQAFSFEFSKHDKIFIEISDNLKPNNIYQQRLFSPSIIDPTDYLLVEDAKYYPANLTSIKSPSIRFNLRSQSNILLPQPLVDLSISHFKTPGYKSGTGTTSLFLKPDNSIELFLKDIVFDYNLSDKGETYLNVDNFKRCFRYGFNINAFGSPYSLSMIKNNEIRFSGDLNYSDQKILTFPI
ncbi:MAG: hypothetical protein K2X39_01000, partial [Silvanigrellaceae bacterium]|nr:hypothetical protein [Silvanigrellaceae bacterium]